MRDRSEAAAPGCLSVGTTGSPRRHPYRPADVMARQLVLAIRGSSVAHDDEETVPS